MPATAAAGAPPALRVSGFGGSSNWPLFVADDRGFFAREGVRVELEAARDSASQLARLAEGRTDIAMTAMDNVVAWHEGAAGRGAPDLVAFLGVNNGGRLALIAAPDIHEVAALAGRRIAVDALETGYAFVLREMLDRAGLEPGRYDLVSVGGSRQRWEALREGRVSAALLNAPVDAAAEKAGFRRLASSSSSIGRYQGSVGAARRDWMSSHETALVSFIRAYVAALEWLRDPAHAQAARSILVARQPGMREEEAARSYDELLDPARGSLSADGALDVEGVRNVIELRKRYAQPPRDLGDPSRYLDTRCYERARRRAAQ